jgi:hypothetical protein
MKARVLLIVAVVLGFAAIARADVVYDPATDWSISNGNPNGVWSYLNGSGGLYTRSGMDTGAPAAGLQWWKNASGDDPNMTYNSTDSELVGWTIHWAPHEIGMGPSGDANGTILRWTAPTAGSWAVSALFTRTQEGNDPGTIYVTKNGTELFSHGVGSYGASSSYSDTLTFAVGQTLDFRVNGDCFVRPEITITSIPEPAAIILAVSGLLGLLAYAWRKRR